MGEWQLKGGRVAVETWESGSLKVGKWQSKCGRVVVERWESGS